MSRWLLCLSLLVAAATEASEGWFPVPARSERLLTVGMYVKPIENVGATFGLTLKILQPSGSPIYVLANFENPAKSGSVLRTSMRVAPWAKTFDVVSPAFSDAQNFHKYDSEVTIFSDSKHHNPIGKHKQQIAFAMPETILDNLKNRFKMTIR